MQRFALSSGYTVTARRVPGTALVEFTTRNPDDDVISTVRRSFAESVPFIKHLRRRH